MPTLSKRKSTSTPSWPKLVSRTHTAVVYINHVSKFARSSASNSRQARLRCYTQDKMCPCTLHNHLVEHPVPKDWFDSKLDQVDELNQTVNKSNADTRRIQIFCIHVG